jgi:serine/threonine-protein kinase
MGEVYRAEDLKLSQTVAIKFLPQKLSQDESALQRFRTEVRIARQVSHPNVCRMFDIGEVEGITFLTMEFVDGEDLASLIRRIGRLPQDKAVEVARQICAGLAAAHDKGVIHRDLKPANIMLDGLGKVRINDFGLAGIAATIQGAEVRAGTPAYMAPEQLAGSEVTFKSDIYSLGLVLYEILTGKRAFEASTLQELVRLRDESAPVSISSHVRDIDPLIERVIFRCLDKDPGKRPASALQVSAALPGGDPLAAALAAGETPSPQMVAASGETSGLSPKIAVPCVIAALLCIALITYLGVRESGLERMTLDHPPEVLKQKAREMMTRFGYTDRAGDSAQGFEYVTDYIDYIEKNDKPRPNWNDVLKERSPLLLYWYRQSPMALQATDFWRNSLTPGVVSVSDPPPLIPGMVTIRLDPQGRLVRMLAIPPERDTSPPPQTPMDWSALFAAADVDPAQVHSVPPEWTNVVTTDTRAAWEGLWPGTNRPLHIEAASFHGKPVYFIMMGPWTQQVRSFQRPKTGAERLNSIVGIVLAICLFVGASLLAYRNYKKGKGDRHGAWRLAVSVLSLELLICLFRSHFMADLETLFVVILAVSTGLFVAGVMWTFYMALEPYVRKYWPQTIISWTRVLEGRFRDPLVGRDLLSGILLGAVWSLTFEFGYRFSLRAGSQPLFGTTELFLGLRQTVSYGLATVITSILGTLIFFLVLVMLRVFLRNRWLAAVAFVVIFATPKIILSDHRLTEGIVWVLIYAIAAVAVVRFGLVVLATAGLMANTLLNLPYTFNPSNWYALDAYLILAIFIAVSLWGFYTSLGGKKLIKGELFD